MLLTDVNRLPTLECNNYSNIRYMTFVVDILYHDIY